MTGQLRGLPRSPSDWIDALLAARDTGFSVKIPSEEMLSYAGVALPRIYANALLCFNRCIVRLPCSSPNAPYTVMGCAVGEGCEIEPLTCTRSFLDYEQTRSA